MQKVVYSISKVNKDEKLKGVGYLVEGNLLIPSTSSKGNAYIRVFEDVAEKCKAVANTDNEFKGYVTVAYKNIMNKTTPDDIDEIEQELKRLTNGRNTANMCLYKQADSPPNKT